MGMNPNVKLVYNEEKKCIVVLVWTPEGWRKKSEIPDTQHIVDEEVA